MAKPWEKYAAGAGGGSKPWEKYGGKPAEPKGDAVGAAIEGFGQGASMGYLPQLQAMAGQLVPDPNAGLDADLAAKGFDVRQGNDAYLQLRDENIARQKGLAETNPYIYNGAQVGGAIATAPLAELGVAKLAPGLLTANRARKAITTGAAIGAAQNPGDKEGEVDPYQAVARLKNAAIGGALGGVLDKGAEKLGSIPGRLQSAEEELGTLAEKNALKAAGAQKAQFKKLGNTGKTKDVGRFIIDENIAPPGAVADDVLENANKIRKSAGEDISSAFDQIEKSGRAGTFNRKELAHAMRDSLQGDEAVGGSLDSEEVLQKLEKYVQNFEGKDGPATARELLELKGKFDGRVNYSKKSMDLPELQQGYKNLRSTLNEAINDRAEALSNNVRGDIGQKLKDANRRYGLASQASEIAENKAAQDGNRVISLTDTIAGGAGAAAGVATGGLGAIPGAMAGALANKALRTYGPSLSVKALDKAAALAGGAGRALEGKALPAAQQLRLAALEQSLPEEQFRRPLLPSQKRARLKAMGER